jgi:hypothetical protein
MKFLKVTILIIGLVILLTGCDSINEIRAKRVVERYLEAVMANQSTDQYTNFSDDSLFTAQEIRGLLGDLNIFKNFTDTEVVDFYKSMHDAPRNALENGVVKNFEISRVLSSTYYQVYARVDIFSYFSSLDFQFDVKGGKIVSISQPEIYQDILLKQVFQL